MDCHGRQDGLAAMGAAPLMRMSRLDRFGAKSLSMTENERGSCACPRAAPLIGPWKYPRWIVSADSLPKTAAGKIRRHLLR